MSERCDRCGGEMKLRDPTLEEKLFEYPVKQYFCSCCGKAGKTVIIVKEKQ